MHLEVTCPGCGRSLAFAIAEAGNTSECPRCGTRFTVPAPGQSPTDVVGSEYAPALHSRPLTSTPEDLSDRGIRIVSALFVLLAILKGVLCIQLCTAYFSLTDRSPSQIRVPSITNHGLLRGSHPESGRIAKSILGTILALTAFESVSLFLAGRWLRLRRRYSLCFLASLLACITIPFGTALGVVTIVLLQEPQVHMSFLRIRPDPAS